MKLAARTLPLSKRDWIVFDYLDGLYRMSYYRPSVGSHDAGELIPEARVAAIKPGGDFKPKAGSYRRVANKRKTLASVLQTVLGEGYSPHHPDTVEAYIRATPWGAKLP